MFTQAEIINMLFIQNVKMQLKLEDLERKVEYLTNASNRHEAVIGEVVEDIEDINEDISKLDDGLYNLKECHNNLVDVVMIDDEDEEEYVDEQLEAERNFECDDPNCACHCKCLNE